MNKIDKFLYGEFAVVAIGGLVTMLVSVFSPPKQMAEETDKTQKATPRKQIGGVPNQMEQWWQGVEAARLQREADEQLAKLIKNDPGLAKAIQEEEDAKRAKEEAERKEKEWWESRKDWVEQFPFDPTHHSEIRFDPTVYDPNRLEEWPEEKKGKEYWKMKQMVDNHSYLRRFYESRLPYTEEFEEMFNILKEELGEDVNNPRVLGGTFESLKDYHQANAQLELTVKKPPSIVEGSSIESLTDEELKVYINLPVEEQLKYYEQRFSAEIKEYEIRTQKTREQWNEYMSPPIEERDINWGEQTENLKESILGALMCPRQNWQGITKDRAIIIRDRLINEIPAEGFLEMTKTGFSYVHEYKTTLKLGDPLLIK